MIRPTPLSRGSMPVPFSVASQLDAGRLAVFQELVHRLVGVRQAWNAAHQPRDAQVAPGGNLLRSTGQCRQVRHHAGCPEVFLAAHPLAAGGPQTTVRPGRQDAGGDGQGGWVAPDLGTPGVELLEGLR